MKDHDVRRLQQVNQAGSVLMQFQKGMNPRSRVLLVLTALFLLSVVVRWPLLNRPLGSHQEWLTSTVLRTMQIWETEGAWKSYKFLPIVTYPGLANYHIDNQGGVPDPLGRQYYLSYPPLAYIAPYVVLRTLGIRVDVLPLQIFSLILHYACGLLVYLIVAMLMRHQGSRYARMCGVIAAAIYIFSPATLWFHSNIYMSDMFVQPLFILGVYLYLKIQLSKTIPVALLITLGAVVLLMIYTEWLGAFFAFAVFLHGVYRWRTPAMRWMMVTVLVASILAVLLILLHYSQVDGLSAFLHYSKSKFLERSALSDKLVSRLSLRSWTQVMSHYTNGFFPGTIGYIIVIALAALILSRFGSRESRKNQLLKPAIYVVTLPVILHHVILFNFTFHHDFSALKSAVLLAILAGVFSGFVLEELDRLKLPKWRWARVVPVFCFLGLICWVNVTNFYDINLKGAGTGYRDSGLAIRQLAQPNEVVFVVVTDPLGPYPQLVWYAKRNLAVWIDETAALQLMALNNADRAIVFTMTPDIRITKVQKFLRQGNTLVSQMQGDERTR